jgi:hypothetical protein
MRNNVPRTLLLGLTAILLAEGAPGAVQVGKAQSLKGAPVAPGASGVSSRSAPALHILSDTTLGEPLNYAVDVRWASDESVYLALKKRGVVEYKLDGKGTPLKQMIPGQKEPGGFWLSYHVAASPRYLVAGAPLFALTWRPLDSAVRKEESFEGIDDVDLQGDKVALIGVRRDSNHRFAPDGAIAWTGSLDLGLTDLRPLLFDARGPGAPNMAACGILLLGVTRFLSDGSLWMVPGVQPGIYHFDPKGKLVQTLDSVALGVDTDCSSVSKELGTRMLRDFRSRGPWINARHIVDDILPLPAGPGLLIRSFQQGQVRWALKVLHPDGSIASYDLPIHPQTPLAHLKGDFRHGRLVLLLWEYAQNDKPDEAPMPHLLLLASAPES